MATSKRRWRRSDLTTTRVSSKIRKARCIVHRSCYTLLRLLGRHCGMSSRSGHQLIKLGDSFDISTLVFTKPTDFLVSNKGCGRRSRGSRFRKIRADDIKGKTILIYMIPMTVYHPPGGLSRATYSLISSYKERDYDFDLEVVFVPVHRGPSFLDKCTKNRFHDFFVQMPWLAVPKKSACDRIQRAFRSPPWIDLDPCWVLVDPGGTVLLTTDYVNRFIFDSYGIGELFPRIQRMLLNEQVDNPACAYSTWFKLHTLLFNEDRAVIRGEINLNKLLASPCPQFLLTKDGTKVSLSSLENKVVGLYFYNHASSLPSRIKLIKWIYEKAIRLGYDFEIVQINFHSSLYLQENDSSRSKDTDIPWLTLPYMHSCCKRLIRIFQCYNKLIRYFHCSYAREERDRLVIINPHESNMRETCFFDRRGADIIQHFGIEAYPFTRQRVFELEYARRKEEIKLPLIFALGGPPLLRHRGGSYDQVPVSRLWGKHVMLLFAPHTKYKSSRFIATLESRYRKQDKQTNVNAFEVVYISYDTDMSSFDESVSRMPWLVCPYSWEFGHMWRSKIFTIRNDNNNDLGSVACFQEDGELMSKIESLPPRLFKKEYPFFHPDDVESYILEDVEKKYHLTSDYMKRRGVGDFFNKYGD